MVEAPPLIPHGYDVTCRLSLDELQEMAAKVKGAPFLKRVLDCMPELVCVLTPSRQVLVANQAMLVFLGKQDGALSPGARPGELVTCVHAEESPHGCGTTAFCNQCGAFRTIMESITRGERAAGECRITQYKTGKSESLDLYLWCSPFELDGLTLYVLAIVNISDQKRRQALERIFFHDLLNSFSSLTSHVQLLQSAPRDQIPRLADRLSHVSDSLVQEVLAQRDLMLAESDRLIVNPSLVNPSQMLQRVADVFQNNPLLKDRYLQIAPLNQQESFVSDAVLLKRILVNMAKNGLEASQPGEMVTMGYDADEKRITFWVHNPQVIAPEHQLQVFKRSFSTKGPGRGLGTYSIKLLSERYLEGEVGFSSAPERGTRFWVSLPLRPSFFPSKPSLAGKASR
jgi:hypothetical protein